MVCESESLQCANYWECDCAQDMSFDNQCTRDYSTDFQFVFTAETCDSKKSCLQAVYDASIIQEVIVLQAISSLIECLPQENTNASGEDTTETTTWAWGGDGTCACFIALRSVCGKIWTLYI